MKPLALQLYSVRDAAKDDFAGTLKKVAEMGYAGVELAGMHGHTAEQVRDMLQDVGLKATSVHQGDVTSENVSEVAESARMLRFDNIVIPHRPAECFHDPMAIEQLANDLEVTAGLLEAQGMTLSYHNHDHEMVLIDGRHAFEILLELAPRLRPQVDTYWASDHGKYDPAEFVANVGARARSIHIKDGPLEKGAAMTALGTGRMDIPAVVEAADAFEGIEWLIVELDRCDGDMLQAVEQSAKYMIGEGLAEGR
jgi:sugar phosphate isomerase/epimerase